MLIKPVQTSEELELAFEVRRLVFQIEQKVAAEEEFDAHDKTARHWLVMDGSQGIATARVRPVNSQDPDVKQAKIERMAVLAGYRGQSVGRRLMEQILNDLRSQGFQVAKLHAQVQAQGFYQRLGFVAQDPIFDEAGIPHRLMTYQF